MVSPIHAGRTLLFRCIACLALLELMAPVSHDVAIPSRVQAEWSQEMLDHLRAALSIEHEVQIAVVVYHPFVFAVEPLGSPVDRFRLSIEFGFLQRLTEKELRAALAHELGHVWIFTHHPFLQTERLANETAQRVVARRDLEALYWKLWAYEQSPGVPLERLLGPLPIP